VRRAGQGETVDKPKRAPGRSLPLLLLSLVLIVTGGFVGCGGAAMAFGACGSSAGGWAGPSGRWSRWRATACWRGRGASEASRSGGRGA
jgi:hypothetical protein